MNADITDSDPTDEADTETTDERIDQYVEVLVATFPPMTARQLDLVAALLRPGASR